MFIMTVCINGEIKSPRLFKTRQSAYNAMFDVLEEYASKYCRLSAANVIKDLLIYKMQVGNNIEFIGKIIDNWWRLLITPFSGTIYFLTECVGCAKPCSKCDTSRVDKSVCCEVNIANMDEIEVE